MQKAITDDQLEQIRRRKQEHLEKQIKKQELRNKFGSEKYLEMVEMKKQEKSRRNLNDSVDKTAIIAAVLMFLFGSISLVFAILLRIDYFDIGHVDRSVPLFVIGSILFLPGAYMSWIAYCSWKRVAGYGYDMIPKWEE